MTSLIILLISLRLFLSIGICRKQKAYIRIGSILLIQTLSFSAWAQKLEIKPQWLKEVEIAGARIQQLRVPEADITGHLQQYIYNMQQELSYAFERYQLGEQVTTYTTSSYARQVKEVNPNWPVEYYIKEMEAYQAYNKISHDNKRRYNDSVNKDQAERSRLQDLTRGYCFISKPVVILKAGVMEDNRTMGKIYFGSYIKVEDTDELGVAVVTIDGMTGQIHTSDYVNDIHKLKGTEEEMKLFKSQRYYKFEEDASYVAWQKKREKEEAAEDGAEARKASRAAKARTYITGPRGGCYYINSNGNKVYVDHSYCR